MKEATITVIGVILGLIFGVSGISFLFNILSETATELSKLSSAASLLVLIAIAAIIIIKVRVFSALIVGAVIGAILNMILEVNGIHFFKEIFRIFLTSIEFNMRWI